MAGTEQDEIEKIMSEIEELQKDMGPKAPSQQAQADTSDGQESNSGVEDDILREIQSTAQSPGDAAGLEEILGSLNSEGSDGGLLNNELGEEVDAAVVREVESPSPVAVPHFASRETMATNGQDYEDGAGEEGTLSLTLQGKMTLKLKYEYEGQEVVISFADQSLRVQMSDGTEFKVPVVRNGAGSKNNVKPFKKAV